MSADDQPRPDFEGALAAASARAGFRPDRVVKMRHFVNAVYLLPAAGVVARVGHGAHQVAQATVSLTVTRWLADQGFPTVEPAVLPSGETGPVLVDQPAGPMVVTFWQYHPQPPDGTPTPGPAHLGQMARRLHDVPPPDGIVLAPYRPLTAIRAVLNDGPVANGCLNSTQNAWLRSRVDALMHAYANLDFPLGAGLIHGDMYLWNLLWAGESGRPVDPAAVRDGTATPLILDWDDVGIGPREIDLIAMYAETRFVHADGKPTATAADVAAFAQAYGYDLREWAGYPTLLEMRDVTTLSALIVLAPADPARKAELDHRLDTLLRGDQVTKWHLQWP